MEPALSVLQCPSCAGAWIPRTKYDAWIVRTGSVMPETTPPSELQVKDIAQAKVCPQCSHLLLKYRIGHGLAFLIDNCTSCGGFWLDGNEWKALKSHHLHDKLVHILGPTWQKDALREEVRAKVEQTYSERLGAEAFARSKDVKAWLKGRPDKAMILAFLSENDT